MSVRIVSQTALSGIIIFNMSTSVVILIVAVVVVLNGGFLWFLLNRLNRSKENSPEQKDQGMSLMLQHINDLSRTINDRMGETTKQVHESMKTQFSESAKLIRDVTQGLTKLDETNKQVVSFADQLQSLQDILKNPKQRGILGEYYLETLLKNVMPPGSFQMQYPFADGTIVDAVVFVKEKIIPIDSKFSLENYNRLVEEKDPTRREE